ncbi:aminoglycoside adenylyltransferase domain-containing protein [Dactylosporangium cerinum]|uniref:Aminoglycoside adenylyltransferase domain-containing protein n=1 Tax=Dactylosporangium cerinum TaxID=1434730 RepID=A0ABV9VWC0_9ACTN
MTPPPDVLAHATALAGALVGERDDVVGVYLHGSAVLGGFRAPTSDVDVLVVVRATRPEAAQRALGERLAAVPGCPGSGIELSAVTAATAADLGDCPFEVHVNTTAGTPTVVPGAGHAGDPDLILHSAVCREHGVAVTGPPPAEVFGAVDRGRILTAMIDELASPSLQQAAVYAVLNACRATRFAAEGRLGSKLEGGEWFLRRHGPNPVVGAALTAQRHGRHAPFTRTGLVGVVRDARAFVATVREELLAAQRAG